MAYTDCLKYCLCNSELCDRHRRFLRTICRATRFISSHSNSTHRQTYVIADSRDRFVAVRHTVTNTVHFCLVAAHHSWRLTQDRDVRVSKSGSLAGESLSTQEICHTAQSCLVRCEMRCDEQERGPVYSHVRADPALVLQNVPHAADHIGQLDDLCRLYTANENFHR